AGSLDQSQRKQEISIGSAYPLGIAALRRLGSLAEKILLSLDGEPRVGVTRRPAANGSYQAGISIRRTSASGRVSAFDTASADLRRTHQCGEPVSPIGRVEMWRGGRRCGLSVAAPFVWRCPSNLTMAPFPHPAHRTGHADLPHPALGQNITPSPTTGHDQD